MEFSKEQKQAITHRDGPMLVLAGPGSGKTAVIIHRVQYLVEHYEVPEDRILVISFTKTAALEMEQRFLALSKHRGAKSVWFSTFHAFFFRILREHGEFSASSLLKENEKFAILRDVLYRLYPKRVFEKETMILILSEIARYKRQIPGKESFVSHIDAFGNDFFEKVRVEYDRQIRAGKRLDFEDMQLLCYELLLSDRNALAYWQDRFSYICVDEYQDIDPLQYELLRMLAGQRANLFVVGDDDQSIYAFRGAAPYLVKRFQKDYRDTKTVILARNYRSCVNVTKASSAVIKKNRHRMPKIFSNHDSRKGIFLVEGFPTRAEEYESLLSRILSSGRPLSEQAILFRTNRQPFGLLMQLDRKNIPYTFQGRVTNLWDHWMTQDIAAYFRLARGERERKDFLRIANRPVRYLPRDVFTRPIVRKEELYREVMGRNDLYAILQKLFFDIEMLSKMNPIAGINYIRKAIGYEDFLLAYAREQGIDRVELLEQLEELSDTMHTAKSYEEWEENMIDLHSDNETKIQKKEDRKAPLLASLPLMTFHASKGLEFPVVYLIDVNEGIVPHRRAKTEEELEEERRAFYVAMTRAKEELYLFYAEKRGGREQKPSRFLLDSMCEK